MSDKKEDNNKKSKKSVVNDSTNDREKELDLFGGVWEDEDEEDNSEEESILEDEFNDFSLDGNKKDTTLNDLDSAFDQIISHYEISSAEKNRINEAKKNEEETKLKQDKLMKNKMEQQAKRDKELDDRKKKREKKEKKFNYKKSSDTQNKILNYTDKYDKYADDYYDY